MSSFYLFHGFNLRILYHGLEPLAEGLTQLPQCFVLDPTLPTHDDAGEGLLLRDWELGRGCVGVEQIRKIVLIAKAISAFPFTYSKGRYVPRTDVFRERLMVRVKYRIFRDFPLHVS
jgi:hypothetical protein